MKSLQELSERLRAERVRRGLSQAEFARLAGIACRSYQRLEAADSGARLALFLRALAALGLELEITATHRPTLDELETVYGHET